MEITRKLAQDTYIRVCKDCGCKLEWMQAIILAAKIWGIDQLVFFSIMDHSFYDLERIAKGEHPVCTK
jgi:hypothetical protein